METPLVDAVVVVGLAVVCPLSLGSPRRWLVAAAAAALALILDTEPIAIAITAVPVTVAGWSLLDRLREAEIDDVRAAFAAARSLDALVAVVVPVWAIVGASSLVASVAEIELFGIGEPIVRLTAIHYLYAGVGALTVAVRVRADGWPPARIATLGVVATAVAPPIVAGGFVLGHPIPQVGGALLMTVGIWSVAVVLVGGAINGHDPRRRLLCFVAGLAPWVPMVLAVAWATAQHVDDVAALSVPDMARIHGTVNGFGFVIAGLVATRPRERSSPVPAARGATA